MRTTENIRIHQVLESQLELSKTNEKIKELDREQDNLNAAFWVVSAIFIMAAYLIVYI